MASLFDTSTLLRDDKIRLIRQRYKSTKDLHTYMVERRKFYYHLFIFPFYLIVGYLLPSLKQCRLSHIMAILTKRKKVLLLKDVSAKKTPSWPELSVKQCYHAVTANCPEVLEYLPDLDGKEQRLPERDYFWATMWTLMPD